MEMCKRHRIVQIRLRLLDVCSPLELGRDLQYTHKTPTIIQQDCGGTHPPVVSVLFREYLTAYSKLSSCYIVVASSSHGSLDFPASSTLSFSLSITSHSSSTSAFASVPVQWDIPSRKKTATHSADGHFYAPSIWTVGELLVRLKCRRSKPSSCFCKEVFSPRTFLNCSLRLDWGGVLIKTVWT